jgi:hypothetical protein
MGNGETERHGEEGEIGEEKEDERDLHASSTREMTAKN